MHDSAPALCHVLELAVTVELVAKQVPQADRARPDPVRDLRQGGLVHLEQAQLRIPGRQERGRDSRAQIRARSVVCKPSPGREDPCCHGRRGRLPIGRRNDGAPQREPRRKPVEHVRIDGRKHLSGHRRPTSGPDQTRQPADRTGGRDPERQGNLHSHAASLILFPRTSEFPALTPKGDTPNAAQIYGENTLLLGHCGFARQRGKGEGCQDITAALTRRLARVLSGGPGTAAAIRAPTPCGAKAGGALP